ncbi:MAG TPA: hypothetical protein VJC01_01710 [Candidatus Paceibacterota bacterium]
MDEKLDGGRIKDPKIAHEMADIMDPYYKKTLGLFPASKKKMAEGERIAEQYRQKGVKIEESDLPQEVLDIVGTCSRRFTEGCKGGVWRIHGFFRVDPKIGDEIITYIIRGRVDIHDNNGNCIETNNGDITIKMKEGKIIEDDSNYLNSVNVSRPSKDSKY